MCGTLEKINGSKDRYLVINENSLIGKNNLMGKNISFLYLWDSINNKIKYSRGDDIMFDDNEVIIIVILMMLLIVILIFRYQIVM